MFIRFEPLLKSTLWGGDKIIPFKHLNSEQQQVGESWEISGVADNETVVSDGPYQGKSLNILLHEMKAQLIGVDNYRRFGDEFPLLIKFIDAHQDLSIQVHPNDEIAHRQGKPRGKTEMWYIMESEPNSMLYSGLQKEITPEQYKTMVDDGTITDAIAQYKVKEGDVFFLPAGRIHSIGTGCFLVEIQQTSDVTYRIYDYNRPGLDGKPRELHTELASQAIDYKVYPEYRTEHTEDIGTANEILNTPFFSIKVIETTEPFHRNMIKYDSFIILMVLNGDCKLRVRSTGYEVTVPEGNSCLMPAAIADYDIIPTNGKTKVLEAFINNKKTIGKIISDFFHQN